MTATREFSTILPVQGLPMELLRLTSTIYASEEPQVASMLNGLVAARQHDEVICSLMLRRNLLIPAHHGSVARSAWGIG